MIGLNIAKLDEIAVLGAHCDDVAIGAGATLLNWAARRTGLRVQALILTGAGSVRENEERAALNDLMPGAALDVTILDLPDGRLPEHYAEVRAAVRQLASKASADVVLTPQRGDAHQDHRLLAEVVTTVFRDHLILGFEIAKWESDLPTASVYQPVSAECAARKADLLTEHYTSQSARDWFDRDLFLGLMRVRGVQCHSRYAEAYVAEKLVLTARNE